VNQDSVDDGSGAPVTVVAFGAGVVVGINSGWEPTSEVRGGNYVWVFDVKSGRYHYYAHLQQVVVHLGQSVKAGQPLGLLGRTGKNAIMPRSPTHLHFMTVAFDGGKMTPYNPWKELVAAKNVANQQSAISN
jgi:murein DD-endopeptidase MepM/ murein hydrolase activator NlpD